MSPNEPSASARPRRVRGAVGPLTALVFMAQADVASARPAAAPAADPGLAALHRTAALAGFLAYGLMVATICWGILTTTHLARRGIRRQALYGGHTTMAIMTISFLVMHIAGNVFSPKARLSALNAFVPFARGSTFAVSLGVVGAELIVAIAASVWLQRRLGYRRWHALHWLSYPAYSLALAHTVMAGSDVHRWLVAVAIFASVTCVLALFILRALPSTSLVRTRVAPFEH